MSVDTHLEKLLADLPEQVVNELAILEDRALRAEQHADRISGRVAELQNENGMLRAALDELRGLAYLLKARAEQTSEQAAGDAEAIEEALRHALVVMAG